MSHVTSKQGANLMLSKHFARHLRGLQFALKSKFGQGATSSSGENTISIGPDRIEMSDDMAHIVARGPVKIATVLVRKRRKK